MFISPPSSFLKSGVPREVSLRDYTARPKEAKKFGLTKKSFCREMNAQEELPAAIYVQWGR
jgi:hypothetical protein